MKSLSTLLVIATVVAAFGCRTSNQMTILADTCNGGYLGNSDPSKPLVCVDVSGTSAIPLIDPVHVYAKGRNGAAAQITWASHDPKADLHISLNPSQNCVKSVACPQKRACVATIVDTAHGGTQCEYQISNGSGGRPIDPIIIIDTCCAAQ
jgi:hypothetical protein